MSSVVGLQVRNAIGDIIESQERIERRLDKPGNHHSFTIESASALTPFKRFKLAVSINGYLRWIIWVPIAQHANYV